MQDVATPDMAPTCAATPPGLKARYRAENDATDVTGTFNGTTVGANFGYTPGKYGAAFLFDGVDDTVTIDDGDLLWPSASFSLEAWVRTSATAAGFIIAKYACGDQCPANVSLAYFGIYVTQGGHPGFDFRPDSPTQDITSVVASTVNIADGNWHHVVGVRDSTAAAGKVYVDGALAATVSAAAEQFGPMTNADSNVDLVTIGSKATGGQANSYDTRFTGAIDEVAIYHSALSAAQIAAIYAAPDGKCL